MHRYIDADELLELYDIDLDGLETDKQWTIPLEVVKQNIKDMPTADVESVKHGHWEQDGHHIRCSECGIYLCDTDREGDNFPKEYCPNCGAKMDGKEQKHEGSDK